MISLKPGNLIQLTGTSYKINFKNKYALVVSALVLGSEGQVVHCKAYVQGKTMVSQLYIYSDHLDDYSVTLIEGSNG